MNLHNVNEFYLRRHLTGSLEIVSGENLSSLEDLDTTSVVEQGDKDALTKTKNQLENNTYVRMMREVRPPSPPLCKIQRVVAVTSSGNTKYSTVSEPEPFEDSGDEFIPSPQDEDSDSFSETTSVRSRFPNVRKATKILKFTSNAEENSTAEIEETSANGNRESERSSPATNEPTSTSVNCADITICNKEEVTVNIFTPLHCEKYSCPSAIQISEDRKETLKSYISKTKKFTNHKCHPVDPRKYIGYVILPSEQETIILSLNACCQEGSAVGKMMYVDETKTWVAFLKFSCDELLDEADLTPVKKSGKAVKDTKLKKHFCMFCKKLITCIGRHYKTQHSSEEKVKEILEAGTMARRHSLMRKLRLEADFMYNKTVSLTERIPIRKPQIQMTAQSVHCPCCSGLISAKLFHKHHRRCARRAPDRQRRLPLVRSTDRSLHDSLQDNDKLFQTVLNNMRGDELKDIIQKDLVMKLLSVFYMKSQIKTHNIHNIRQFLRRSARLFLEAQKLDPEISEMKDLLVPGRYDLVMNCIRKIANFGENPESRKACLALSFGPLLTKMINLYKIHLMKTGISMNDPLITALDTTLQIHEQEFRMDVTRSALVSMKHKRMSATVELPTTKDIQLLVSYIKRQADLCYDSLKNTGFNFHTWSSLGKALLCQLLVFNRRRIGEMSRTQLNDFRNRRDVSEDYFQSLNRLQVILAKEFSVFRIMAKRSRAVNVLINKKQIEQLEYFVSLREKAGLTDSNSFLFGTPGQADGYMKANVALRQFAEECGASKPSVLTGTYLRKHVATISQMFSLTDNEIQQLSDFLGHDRRVHELHYRLDEHNTQITKLSKFLCAVGDADVCSYKGKTLDELPYEPDTSIDDDEVLENTDDDLDDAENEESNIQPSTSKKIKKIRTDSKSLGKKHPGPSKPCSPMKTPKKYILRKHAQKSPKIKSPITSQLLNVLADPGKRKQSKRRWNQVEVETMHKELSQYLEQKRLPPWNVCRELKLNNQEIFKNRDVRAIYCWMRNYINK